VISNGINILAGDDPIPIEFGSKGTDPNRKDAHFMFHMRRAVQSVTVDLLVVYSTVRMVLEKLCFWVVC